MVVKGNRVRPLKGTVDQRLKQPGSGQPEKRPGSVKQNRVLELVLKVHVVGSVADYGGLPVENENDNRRRSAFVPQVNGCARHLLPNENPCR